MIHTVTDDVAARVPPAVQVAPLVMTTVDDSHEDSCCVEERVNTMSVPWAF